MRIAIIGAGHVGKALGGGLAEKGHDVVLAAKHPEKAIAAAQEIGAKAAPTPRDAVEGADMVIVAVPASARADVADELRDSADGLTVVDVTNVVNADATSITAEHSGAEDLQAMMPEAHIVKAFNTLMSSHMAHPVVDGAALDGFYAGDDEEAKEKVRSIMEDLGYRPIDAGPLSMARAMEDLALLNVRLNRTNGWSWQTEWKLVGPMS